MNAHTPSRFNIAVSVKNRDIRFKAVYNTLSRAHVLIPADQWDLVAAGAMGDSIRIAQLTAQGILVEKQMDERLLFKQWKERLTHDFSHLRSKILVSRQCNLRCTYCIMDKEPMAMTTETARAMDAFYLERIKDKKPRMVRDDYLGGEPLLNTEVILASATRRNYFCRGRSIDYQFFITTNGTLATPEVIAKLINAGLAAIRVSLAGPAAVHDKLRPLNGGGGTYAAIIRNLAQISTMVPIHIEYQYDAGSDDYRHLPKMLEEMAQRKIEIAEIAFTPILAKRRNNHFCADWGDVEKYLSLRKAAVQHGISTPDSVPSSLCMTDIRSALVFDTDGSLIPCPSLQAAERAYGDVRTGIDFMKESLLLERRLPERCLQQCELLPLCKGGCRLQALIHSGDFSGMDCHYNSHRRLLENYILENAHAALTDQHRAK